MTLVTGKPLLSFFVLAYGLSWAYWIPLALAGIRTAPGSTATHEPGLLGPALAAFIVTGLTQGRVGLTALARRLVLVSRPTWRFLAYSLSPVCSQQQIFRGPSCDNRPVRRAIRARQGAAVCEPCARRPVLVSPDAPFPQCGDCANSFDRRHERQLQPRDAIKGNGVLLPFDRRPGGRECELLPNDLAHPRTGYRPEEELLSP